MSGENHAAFLRLFIGIAVPDAVREPIARAQGQLKRCAAPGMIRWTKPEQFHVTLKFLGDVPVGELADLEASVAAVCAGCRPLQLAAAGMGFFPGKHKPRVIWVGVVDQDQELAGLHRQLDAAMRPYAPADKPGKFTGHITLGRFKPGRRMNLAELLKRAEVIHNRCFGDWKATEVELVRCDLTSAGAVHTPIAVGRLAA